MVTLKSVIPLSTRFLRSNIGSFVLSDCDGYQPLTGFTTGSLLFRVSVRLLGNLRGSYATTTNYDAGT